ncbi:MAG: hypothetical protein IKY10_00100 [Clostridia bacterium]|nr:hypothetical protein [Clostridia bacterium]
MKSENFNEFLENNDGFKEAFEDAFIIDRLKTPTKFSIYVEDIEEKLKKSLKTKQNLTNNILFINYKRFLYKHIKELDKNKDC